MTQSGDQSSAGSEPELQNDREAMPVDAEQPPRLAFPVVGIGASAGGLEAIGTFLDAMPPDSGMAFVIVQHLPPDRESMVAEILSRHTQMQVREVEDGLEVEADHVYVIRPGNVLTIAEGRLHLGERAENRANFRPVDDFFKSLAQEQRERAIAIILSGMGSNGSAGAQAIKAVGGLCIAQDPETAEFPSMPRHLIDQGYADYILPPKEMPEVLRAYAEHPYARQERTVDETGLAREQQRLREILAILRTRTKQDFSGYKKPTLLRRVQRRMGLSRLEKLHEYARLLRQSPTEVTALSDDLLIHVTGFFRDAESWNALRERVIVPLVASREAEASVRCWVTACSSGEEAYTLAMLLDEEADRIDKRLDIKVFATDMAERALAHARAGLYPGGIENEIAPERLSRFFDKEDGLYRVKVDLREKVVFAGQNVLQDPPFSRIDIATCRNLLIYLEPQVQQRVITLLHFGIREGGALFLGSSETLAGAEDMFEVIDKKARIFRRLATPRRNLVDFVLPQRAVRGDETSGTGEFGAREAAALQRRAARLGVAQLTHRTLLEYHAPPAVAVDRDYRILYYHGNTRPFLDQPTGEPTRDLLALTREELRSAVRMAVHRAAAEGTTVTVPDGLVETSPGNRVQIAVRASPMAGAGGPDYFVVSFHERSDVRPVGDEGLAESQSNEELRLARDDLRLANEALQTTNEELRASHEEIMSVNEELQSTNEELETSKEEMQSLNEELATVNAQLRAKMEESQSASNDLASLLNSAELAVLFLDSRFRIRRYTPAARELVELIAGDVGRPLSDLARKFTDPQLVSDAERVIQTLRPIEREVEASDQRTFLRRITPYRTTDNRIDGIVIVFLETTDRNRAQSEAAAVQARLQRMVNVPGVGILTFTRSGTLFDANESFLQMSGYSRADVASGKLSWRELTPPEHVAVGEQQLNNLEATGVIGPYEKEYLRKNGERCWMLFAGASFGEDQIIEYCIDIDERKRAQLERDRFFALAQDLLAVAQVGDGRFKRVSPSMTRVFGYSEEELLAMRLLDLVHLDDRETLSRRSLDSQADDSITRTEIRLRCKDGEYRWIEWLSLEDSARGLLYCAGRDVTERRRAEAAIRIGEEQSRLLIEGIGDFAMLMTDPAGKIVSWTSGAERLLGFSESEAVGKSISIIFTPEDRAAGVPEAEMAKAAEAGKTPDERWHIHKDGTRFWGSGTTSATRDPADGSLRGFVKIMLDNTARKMVEEALQAAKEDAELASRAKDEFLAMLSHELRTPLSSILIWSKLLRTRKDASPEYAEAFDAISRSAEAQRQLIDDLLDTSRITAGKLRLEMRRVELAPTVRSAVDSVLPAAQAKGIEVHVDVDRKVGVVSADPDRLRQVIWNLVNNAIKFTPGGGRIDVGLWRRGNVVEIRVSDNGKGIDPGFLPHVFEPFRQAETSIMRVYGGLGLGLSICKQLVEQHGGTITAESAGPDKGATFTVRLPLPPLRPSGASGSEPGSSGDSSEATALAQVRVLLVEDDGETRKAMSHLLRYSGATVTAVESAAAAVEAFKRSRPDLMLIDVGLPDEDGYRLIRRLRDLEAGASRCPAVAVTAFAHPDDLARAMDAGFDQHIGKPFEPRALVAKLAALVGR